MSSGLYKSDDPCGLIDFSNFHVGMSEWQIAGHKNAPLFKRGICIFY